jgi:MFS family permease
MAMMQQSLGFFFIDFYQLSPVDAARQVGFAMMCSAAASLTVQFTVVQKARISKEAMISLALPLLTLAYLVLFLHSTMWMMFLAMTIMGLGMGMAYPALAAAATTYCSDAQQSSITGLITATTAMGYIVGPPLAALAYQQQIALPFAIASLLIAVTTCVIFMTLRFVNKQSNTDHPVT